MGTWGPIQCTAVVASTLECTVEINVLYACTFPSHLWQDSLNQKRPNLNSARRTNFLTFATSGGVRIYRKCLYPPMSKAFTIQIIYRWCSMGWKVRSFGLKRPGCSVTISLPAVVERADKPQKVQESATQVVSWGNVGWFTIFNFSRSPRNTAVSSPSLPPPTKGPSILMDVGESIRHCTWWVNLHSAYFKRLLEEQQAVVCLCSLITLIIPWKYNFLQLMLLL